MSFVNTVLLTHIAAYVALDAESTFQLRILCDFIAENELHDSVLRRRRRRHLDDQVEYKFIILY